MDVGSMVLSGMLVAITMFCIILGMRGREGFIFLIFAVLCSIMLFLQNWMIGLLMICLSGVLLLGSVMSGVKI